MSYITLNKYNFFHNLDEIVKKTKDINKVALVLKDNAYGHGLHHISKLAQEYGIEKAIVQNSDEAKEIDKYFKYILVLADKPKEVSSKIRYTINDINSITDFPSKTKVELKVNTGMNRNGIEMEQLEMAIELIKKQGLALEAVFTHHGSADEINNLYNIQKNNFLKVKEWINKRDIGVRYHSCNSAALFREDDFDEDMARVGIAAYGCLEMPKELAVPSLTPILSLYAQKISSRLLKKGECVGYGATFMAKSDMMVSNYDFGYGAGFLRASSHKYITPDGVKIVGRISMDNSSFLSDKDELMIFDDAREAAKYADTISYEVLTSLKAHIKRVVL
jgi:alanine racemase